MNLNFNTGIPSAGNNPSDDQPLMQVNTNSEDAIWTVDHYGFRDNNGGLHKQVRLVDLLGIPTGLLSGMGTLYTKLATSTSPSTESDVFYSPDASGNEYQLTRAITASFSKFATNTTVGNTTGGWTFLPGGLLLQYGSFDPNTSTTVVFPVAFTNIPYIVGMTQSIDNNSTFRQAAVSTSSLSTTGFIYQGAVSSHINPVYFWAIGK
jgi:hypothetical protein